MPGKVILKYKYFNLHCFHYSLTRMNFLVVLIVKRRKTWWNGYGR